MKKSKFLKSSKDMLSRSFNPSKCKTSLRLAASRLKLLRNKKEAQVKQMRREISVLLESGQDQTARIRVEHVIREEKMMAAFDLIEIYCELIVARLPIIESQKSCPIDLKEAITSVVFASPRCGDVPELVDARKHFTEKYGKEFITSAIELRPDCGVSRMLVEKLSAVAPDVQTKTKILNAIAKEHGVEWDGESIEENSTPASDFLAGPSTFVKVSEQPVEPSRSQAPDIKVPQRTSQETEKIGSARVSGVNTASQHGMRPQAQAYGGDREHLFRGESGAVFRDRPRWNMEFKDATAAAQAAAESAEMASIAARAAADLSRRDSLTKQYSMESNKFGDHSPRAGAPETHLRSKMVSENRSFSEYSRLQNEQIDSGRYEVGRGGGKDYSHSPSLQSRASIDDDSTERSKMVSENRSFSEYSRLKNEQIDRVNLSNAGGRYEAGKDYSHSSSLQSRASVDDDTTERYYRKNVREETIEKQERFSDVNIFSNRGQHFEHDAGEKSSLGFGKEDMHQEATAVVFDKSDSDTEDDGFHISPTYDEPQQKPLSSQISHKHLSTNTDSWSPSPKPSTSKIVMPPASESLTRKSSSSDSVSVAFDESDEEDTKLSSDFFGERKKPVGLQSNDKSGTSLRQTSLSSDYESEEMDSERHRQIKFDSNPPAKLNSWKPAADLVPRKNLTELNSSSEGLNFGKLTGGLRHRGYNYPSFGRNQLDSKETTDDTFIKPSAPPATSCTDSSEEEEPLQKRSNHKHKLYPSSGGKDLKTKPSFVASNSIFGSDNSDLDEDIPKESPSRTQRLHSGISRRTKAFPSDPEKEKLPKWKLRSEALDVDRKGSTSTSSETPKRFQTRKESSKWGSEPAKPDNSTSVRIQTSNADGRSEAPESRQQFQPSKGNSSHLRNSVQPKPTVSKVSPKLSSAKEASMPQTKADPPLRQETLSKTNSNKDSGNQKASHVHPKLPDYDSFVQFFQKNRS